jgi:cell wall-associated NlpC family hydrolase
MAAGSLRLAGGAALQSNAVSTASAGQAIVNAAASQAGETYCFAGGNQFGPTHGRGDYYGEAPDCTSQSTIGFDCTGLTQYATYQGTGGAVNLSYHDSQQAEYAPGQWISSESDLEPGDIVYFGSSRNQIAHAAIYAGGGQIWDANTPFWIYPDGVYERSLASENSLGFVGAARVWSATGTPTGSPPPPASHYQAFVGDFNGDGVPDIGLRDANTGIWFFKRGPGYNDQTTYQWAAGSNYQAFAGDFNGDGITDIELRDVDTGMIYIKHGPDFNDQITYQWAPGANYQVFAGDFNGDGLADIGLRDTNTGIWYIKHGPDFSDQITYQWASGANYQPLVGDWDQDGKADIGLRDANTGIFYFLTPVTSTTFGNQTTYPWAAG